MSRKSDAEKIRKLSPVCQQVSGVLRSTERPVRIAVNTFVDGRGSLGVIEKPALPFDVKRLYFLYDLKADVVRGRHAHKALQQVMVCLAGAVDIVFWDGTVRETIRLQQRDEGVYFPPGYWREIVPVQDQSVLAVLASAPYDESDYIYSEDDYLAYLAQDHAVPRR